MLKFILLIRSTVFFLGYVIDTVVMSTLFILLYPILPTRSRHRFASFWCSTVMFWLRISCGIRYRVIGEENLNLEEAPFVILSNHQSAWETLFLYKLIYPVSPILKKELLYIPFWGWAMALQKPVALNRSKPREAGRALLRIGVERIRAGYSLIVFPEGTRKLGGQLGKFSKGGASLAVATNRSVLPLAHNAGSFWPPGFIKYPGTVTVVIGAALSSEGKTAETLTREVEAWVKENLPMSVSSDQGSADR